MPTAASRSRTTISPADARALRSEAERVLRRNWREGLDDAGTAYAFTCPGPPRYRHQWHWDSCFHAIAWASFEPAHAREELRTVLRSGHGGFLPHTVFWHSPARWRRAPFYATRRMWGDRATESIDPPLLAWAWERVASCCPGDAAFATEALSGLARHLDWLARERDPDGDGLLTIVLPDESGLDDSPKYDSVFGPLVHWRPGYFRLIERCRRHGWEAGEIAARFEEHVEDVWVNVAYAMSLRAMARLAPGEQRFEERAAVVEAALLEKCLDPATGLFYDLAGSWEAPVRVSTWSALSPVVLASLPDDVRRRIVEEHVLHPGRYGAAFGVPSVSMEEPSFRPGFDVWRTWRGPAWTNATWLLCGALRDLGYPDDAARIAGSLGRAALRHGLREYYHPHTGRGLGAHDFSWSALVTDLADWSAG